MKATAFPSTFHSELVLSSIAAAKTMAQKKTIGLSQICVVQSQISSLALSSKNSAKVVSALLHQTSLFYILC